jgi:hypothetical protein
MGGGYSIPVSSVKQIALPEPIALERIRLRRLLHVDVERGLIEHSAREAFRRLRRPIGTTHPKRIPLTIFLCSVKRCFFWRFPRLDVRSSYGAPGDFPGLELTPLPHVSTALEMRRLTWQGC